MTAQSSRRNRTRIQAILWYLGFRYGPRLHPSTLRRFVFWSENSRNLTAYNDIVELHSLLLRSQRPPDASDAELQADTPESLSPFEGDLSPELTVLEGGRQSVGDGGRADEPGFRPRVVSSAPIDAALARTRNSQRWRVLCLGVACAVALIVAINWAFAPSIPRGNEYMTGPGQQRVVGLADGSQVTLGAASEVRVRFTKDRRSIELDRGEALFSVAHDPERPFIVHAGAGTITAIGTEFLVRRYSRYSDRIEVLVTRGVVRVAPLRGLTMTLPSLLHSVHWSAVRLASGEQMSYSDRGNATAIKPSDSHPATELTDGTFVYHGRPLGEVIEDVQRYTGQTITLDEQSAKLMYSGSVLERDVRQWLRGLPQIFPGVEVTQDSDRIVITYVRQPAGGDEPDPASGGGPD
jgi:transmembrane sensor